MIKISRRQSLSPEILQVHKLQYNCEGQSIFILIVFPQFISFILSFKKQSRKCNEI